MAALVKLLWRNRGLDGTWSATSAVATLPASNLADINRRRVWRSTGLASPERVVVDLGAAYAIDAIAIVSHNLTTGATVTLKGHTADSWAAPDFSEAVTVYDDKDADVVVHFLSAQTTKRYWALEITDAANPDGYVEIGVLALGPVFSFGDAPNDFGLQLVDPSIVSRGPAGTPKTEERQVYAEVTLPWLLLTESTVFGDLQTVLRYVGRNKDTVLSVFASAPPADDVSKSLNLYGRLAEIPAFVYRGSVTGNRYDWLMRFVESR